MSSTVAARPMLPPSFETIPELYSLPEHPRMSRPTTRPSTANTATSPYPMYPGLHTPTTDRNRSTDSIPTTLNRPRKLSGSSNSALSTGRPQENPSPGTRSPSWGSIASYESFESAGWRPSYLQHQRPAPIKGLRTRAKPDEMFASLPGEVLEVVLEMLKELHLGRRSDSCATCWMRDLCSLALCSRKWYKVARLALYEDILLVGPDSLTHRKRFKTTQGSRMMLLRRTLRANPDLARLVRSLKVPQLEAATAAANSRGPSPFEQYENAVAALVMAAPNLERLVGPAFGYDHSFKKLFHALSTRTNLKDMNWLVEPSSAPGQQCLEGLSQCGQMMPATLQPSQEIAFLEQHRNWAKLKSLSIHCLPEASLAPITLLARTLTVLPCLQHLHLSNLPANAFNDTNLLSLPRLMTLTLSNIPGISSNGLSSFATRSNSQPLRKLQLRHTPLTSLPALARILSNLASLVTFSLVQSFPPLMPETDSFTLWMMPYLASASVSKLHWDITSHVDSANAADDILARSIEAGGFPALRTLRAPNDPEGVFQGLCRPVERIDLPSDRFRNVAISASSNSLPSSPTKILAKSPTTSSLPGLSLNAPSLCTNLLAARLAAQSRIESARDTHRFQVNVEDEYGSLVEVFGLGSYVGTVGSDIHYHLLPDEGSTDEKGGLVDVTDPGADAGESLAGGREGCDGSWNWREGVVADKREKERWWHTERGRWTRIRLD
ncbi:hypothetical protein TOPH_05916 [Tolypocladium ophioglossoides CBS 100239]|uniref:F-box domain-containing protein n=1 Tax=Tolypocladium ophioglossoides (strain CBS 100239) TaxID=1163406 RepID=A0A0L0N6K0_TOLOC|nr:hypothetical protein TOPH_05916 [Tolypocladium ophioglossoides CBS 100239]